MMIKKVLKIFAHFFCILALIWGTPGVSAKVILVTGILQGEHEITLKVRSQGQIKQIFFKEGQKVKAGDILAVIDDTQETIEKDLALVELESAKTDFEKSSQLKKYVAEEEIQKKKENYLRKKSNYELKEYNWNNKRLISPIDGVITREYIQLGGSVGSGEKAYEIIQLENLLIDIDVESHLGNFLQEGQVLIFTTNLHGKKTFPATIFYISPVVDKASGTIKVKLRLKNHPLSRAGDKDKNNLLFKPGTMVKLKIPFKSKLP